MQKPQQNKINLDLVDEVELADVWKVQSVREQLEELQQQLQLLVGE